MSLSTRDDLSEKEERINTVKKQFLNQLHLSLSDTPIILTTTFLISKLQKYNVPTVVEADLESDSIQALLKGDDNIHGLPIFMHHFLDILPSQHREILASKPELIAWTEDKQYILMPNPQQVSHELLMQNSILAKSQKEGFGLIAWFIHPSLLAKSKYAQKDAILKSVEERDESLRYGEYGSKEGLFKLRRINSFSSLSERSEDQERVSEIVRKSSIRYLSGPFDFKAEDLQSLIQLKQTVMQHLSECYGVTSEDKVDLYFHTHYSIDTTTAHLHVRVNQIRHALEFDKSIFLDEIVESLKKGQDIKDLFMERKVIHLEVGKRSFLQERRYVVREVDNPYLVDIKKIDDFQDCIKFKK
ncbi:MAG: hypothetical protein ACYC0J_00395 [Gammaproteobacteria bacterium]